MKGNVDTELVLYSVATKYDNYDKTIVITSDGDFACLFKFLTEQGRLKKILLPLNSGEHSFARVRDEGQSILAA